MKGMNGGRRGEERGGMEGKGREFGEVGEGEDSEREGEGRGREEGHTGTYFPPLRALTIVFK